MTDLTDAELDVMVRSLQKKCPFPAAGNSVVIKLMDDAADAITALRAERDAAYSAGLSDAADIARRYKSQIAVNEPLWHDGADWAYQRIEDTIRALADACGEGAAAGVEPTSKRFVESRPRFGSKLCGCRQSMASSKPTRCVDMG